MHWQTFDRPVKLPAKQCTVAIAKSICSKKYAYAAHIDPEQTLSERKQGREFLIRLKFRKFNR